jgi:hypothetical protein
VQNNDNEKQECLIISRQKETPDGLTTHVISSANFIMLIVMFLIQQHCDLNVRVAACSFFREEAMDEQRALRCGAGASLDALAISVARRWRCGCCWRFGRRCFRRGRRLMVGGVVEAAVVEASSAAAAAATLCWCRTER